MDPKSPRPERTQTDKSLAVERARTDHGLGEKNAAIEEKADVVIERAREEADVSSPLPAPRPTKN